MLILFRSKTALDGHFFSKLQKCLQTALLLTRSLSTLVTALVYELIACVRRANENSGNLISVV